MCKIRAVKLKHKIQNKVHVKNAKLVIKHSMHKHVHRIIMHYVLYPTLYKIYYTSNIACVCLCICALSQHTASHMHAVLRDTCYLLCYMHFYAHFILHMMCYTCDTAGLVMNCRVGLRWHFCCGCPISKPRLILDFSSKKSGVVFLSESRKMSSYGQK